MLVAKDLNKSYGSLNVLNDISLEVNNREIVSIVGSSGAGKTTLLQILGTLEKPDSGNVTIDGVNPHKLSSRELARFRNSQIGFVFQFHQLLPEFSAVENVMMPALIGGLNRTDAAARAKNVLEKLGLSHRLDHQPSALSGGEQQRVAVARALINSPKVIFADEPSGNLDSANAADLHRLFFELRDDLGQTFVIVTHNEALAEMADRKITMKDGRIFS